MQNQNNSLCSVIYGPMAELVDAADLKFVGISLAGSSPARPTMRNIMKPERLYDLIYDIGQKMGLSQDELEDFLCSADKINDIGTEDLHELVYKLAEEGDLDEESLNNYLNAADNINKNA